VINVPPPASRDGRDAWLSKTGQSTTAPVNRAFPAAVKLESEAELDGGDTIEARRAVVFAVYDFLLRLIDVFPQPHRNDSTLSRSGETCRYSPHFGQVKAASNFL